MAGKTTGTEPAGKTTATEPVWFKKYRDRLDAIERKLDTIEQKNAQITHLEIKVKEATDLANDIKAHYEELKMENKSLRERLLQIEGQSRRNNLLFDGIPEKKGETWEESEKKLKDFLRTDLKLMDANDIQFERVHRLGYNNAAQKPRTLIARFSFFKQRELVWKERTKLSKTNSKCWVSEDYPTEIKRDRQVLLPIMRSAKKQPGVTSCSLKVDKLFINNKQYTVKNLHELPEHLKPENLCTKHDDSKKVTVFFHKDSLLSNFNTTTPITIDGTTYNCVEQFFQHEKSVYHGDESKASQIKNASDPRIQKQIGKQIREASGWDSESKKVMQRGIIAKMEQNAHAADALLATKDYVIGEASKDSVWGTGIPLHHKNCTNTNLWTGSNCLGKILGEVRDLISR